MSQIGVSIPKVDALEKVLGAARYGADVSSEGALSLKLSGVPGAMPKS